MNAFETKFLTYLACERGLSTRTLIEYKADLAQVAAFLGQRAVALEEATSGDFSQYVQAETKRGMSRATIARRIAALRTYMHFRKAQGERVDSILSNLEFPKKQEKLPDVLNRQQVTDILEKMDTEDVFFQRDSAILELMYATGIRATELCNLDLDDINLTQREVRIMGKGRKERIVPFGTPAARALQRYISGDRRTLDKGTGTVFLSRTGQKLTRMALWNLVQKHTKQIEQHVHPHTLRHCFASHLLMGHEAIEVGEKGVSVSLQSGAANIRVVQEFLGHESVETTQVYTHVDTARLKKVHALLGR